MAHGFQLWLRVQVQFQERGFKGKGKRGSELHVSFCRSHRDHPLLGDRKSEQELHRGKVHSINSTGRSSFPHSSPTTTRPTTTPSKPNPRLFSSKRSPWGKCWCAWSPIWWRGIELGSCWSRRIDLQKERPQSSSRRLISLEGKWG